MAVDPQQVVVQGLMSLLAGVLGVSLGAWLTGLYKVKGEITGRAEMMNEILEETRGTAKASELGKLAGRAESINEIANEVVQTTKSLEAGRLGARLEKLDEILREVTAVTETQKRIEASVERRSHFEERVVLDRYIAAGGVFAQIGRVATDLNRHLSGQAVEGLFKGDEIVPLTAVYETISAQRYLLGHPLQEILEGQAQELMTKAKAPTAEERQASVDRFLELQKQFHDEVNRIFRIDKIEWK